MSEEAWSEGYVNNWHQGSAICVADPRRDDHIQILGNLIENAAQGIDVHADHVIVSQNIVDNAFIGMKAMHGARNVLIIGNQFSRNDLWSIGLMPGASSGLARAPVLPDQKPEETEANVDGGSIIANNIISDFGYGTAHWIWGDEGCPLRLDHGQKPENPPLSDVIVQGNLIYDTGRDRVLINGKPTTEAPRYKYAVFIGQDRLAGLGVIRGPQGLHFSGNLFHPGREGVSNVPLQP